MKSQALDLLSIPVMSLEIERVFSSARLLLTDQRLRMNEAIIEEVELTRHWRQQGIDDEADYDLLDPRPREA
jgi:hAT family C-terminal dimerisation region